MTDLGKLPSKAGADPAITAKPRHEPAPGSDDDFMTRLQLALGMTPKQLANALGVPLRDVVDRVGPRSAMSSFMYDGFWFNLQQHVNDKLAGYLAVKEELDRKHRLDYRALQDRQSAIRNRK